MTEKQVEIARRKLAGDVDRFLANGGTINQVPTGVSGEVKLTLKDTGHGHLKIATGKRQDDLVAGHYCRRNKK